MKILCVDTSTRSLCLGVSDSDKVYEYELELGTRISALLVPTIKRVLESLGWKISVIDYFCAGIGPGSFTGIRVGLSTLKALSWSLNKPLVGIPSLDILAQNAISKAVFIIPVIDAKRGLVYSSIYKVQAQELKRVSGYLLSNPGDLVQKIREKIPAKAFKDSVMLGDGLNICCKECSAGLKGMKFLDKDYWRLEGRHLIELAKLFIQDKKSRNAFGVEPLYLYPKECQIRQKKNKKSDI
ncbi:MAG: tRNA (adenosine(37)-N6)-threonylcarbamoyltransferase complex dimerization subunit type 1 TsaB [Candidatus Omnitrophica bacterium]|nr:tRNA (adenosine(37)-N6)-threonylcarbamoyltransferase complex dimerization subunit type 1 TsaB [Candidatus Omnitrophota bacterium]